MLLPVALASHWLTLSHCWTAPLAAGKPSLPKQWQGRRGNLARQPICAQKLRVVLGRTWVDGLKHFHTLEASALSSPLLTELKHHYLVVVATLLVCPGPAGIFRPVSCWGLTIWCCGGGKQSIHLSFCLFTQHSC